MRKLQYKVYLVGMLLVGLVLILAACGSQATTSAPTPPPCPTCAPCPTQQPCPTPAVQVIPFGDEWVASGHADAASAAFTHWNEDDPAVVEVGCAKCHSGVGFKDFTGADGSAAGMVDVAPAIGSVITCDACHNKAAEALSEVSFPSGAVISGLGAEARCMTCHQGNASMVQVDEAITKAAVADDDTPSADLGFTNIHYYAAAVARYGTLVKGGYQYAGQAYDALWEHAAGVDSCVDCHDSHSLELKLDTCATCHTGVATVDDVRAIRMASSMVDYDGDGDVAEGIAGEIEGLQGLLYGAMQSYAKEVAGTAIIYSKDAYPYFFIDTDGDGAVTEGEAAFPNRYNAWTGRLLKAAYNYQTSLKDPGAYVHGGKYIIQLLHDSIADLNTKLAMPVDLSNARRDDPGHFDGAGEPFRHWDETGVVPFSCAKCHTGSGLPQALANGGNVVAQAPSDGLLCETCHSDLTTFALYEVKTVRFPSGKVVAFEALTDNLCLNCHSGVESTVSVNAAVAGQEQDTVNDKLTFRNVHYFAAGATLFGAETQGIYQYAGKEYLGKFAHAPGLDTCTACHDPHMLMVNTTGCKGCHGVDEPEAIRGTNSAVDYDGDGNVTEGIAGEIETLQEKLYAAIQLYAKEANDAPVIYSLSAYPYFFYDTNGDGAISEGEAVYPNAYKSWTPRLLKAGYNLQYSYKDPGAYVHNAKYVMQALFDSLEDLSTVVEVDLTGLVRP